MVQSDARWKLEWTLYSLKIRKDLPQDFINQIIIEDNREQLVEIKENERLVLKYKFTNNFFLRQTVCQKLYEAGQYLPNEYRLVLYDAYRNDKQQKQWELTLADITQKHPTASLKECEKIASLHVTKPTKLDVEHQTGAVVDVTLCDRYGYELYLGTRIHEFNFKTKTNCSQLTAEEQELRKVLTDAMSQAGFKNHPPEWWSFSFGDKLWAAYSGKKKAFYGQI